jgi:hypothetical protein
VRRALAVAVAAAFAAAAPGCGAGYPDLLVLHRTGELPGARLKLLINDGGTVRCDDGPEHRLPEQLLLDARDIVTDLEEEAREDLVLPRPPGALLRFRLRVEQGTVTFSDADAARRPTLGRLVALTRTIAQDLCGHVR